MDTLRTYSMFAFIVLGAGTLQVFWFLRALLCFGFEEKKKNERTGLANQKLSSSQQLVGPRQFKCIQHRFALSLSRDRPLFVLFFFLLVSAHQI